MSWFERFLVCLSVGILSTGCSGSSAPLALSVELPLSVDPAQVRSIGLFVLESDDELCGPYLDRSLDPLHEAASATIVAVAVSAESALPSESVHLGDVPAGTYSVVGEAYDADGFRILMGCAAPVPIADERTTRLDLALVPDALSERL